MKLRHDHDLIPPEACSRGLLMMFLIGLVFTFVACAIALSQDEPPAKEAAPKTPTPSSAPGAPLKVWRDQGWQNAKTIEDVVSLLQQFHGRLEMQARSFAFKEQDILKRLEALEKKVGTK